MIGLVVTGHGHFADGIHTSAQMIAGENDYVRYINFEEGMTPEQLAEKFNAAFDEFKSCDGVVVLSDLPGGSPFKTAVECKYARPEQKIEVIAGTNLPMIVTAVTMLDMEDDPRRSITAFCGGLVICAAKSGSGHPEGHPLPLRFYVIKPCRCCRRPGSCS